MKSLLTASGISLMLILGVFSTSPANAQSAWDLDRQRSQVESQINSALSSGRISVQNAENHRVQLRQNSAWQQSLLGDGVIDPLEAQQVMGGITGIGQSLFNTMQANANGFAGGASPLNSLGAVNSNVFAPASVGVDMSGTINSLSSQLEAGRTSRQLTSSEYSSLRSELDRLSQRMQRGAYGGRSLSEQRSLSTRINNFQVKLNRELNDRDIAGRFGNRWY
jgi:hypothetical protein